MQETFIFNYVLLAAQMGIGRMGLDRLNEAFSCAASLYIVELAGLFTRQT